MQPLSDLPRLPNYGLSGSFGATAADRIALQTAVSRVSGHFARGRVLHFPVLFPCSPEAVHEVLVTKAKSFEKAPGFRVLLHTLAVDSGPRTEACRFGFFLVTKQYRCRQLDRG